MNESYSTGPIPPTGEIERAHHSATHPLLGNLATVAAEVGIAQAESASPEPGVYIGARRLSDGSLDLSSAARVTTRTREAPTVESAITRARQFGIDEGALRVTSQTLRTLDRPLDIELNLRAKIRNNQLGLDHSELLQLVRDYKKEQIRATEKGELTHYHQTGLANLEAIIQNGGLLSTDEQRRRGLDRPSAGSRPDVVQMTRDRYDADGKLVTPGVNKTSANLGAAGEVTFIIDQSVIDSPDYDSIVTYPNVPSVPLEQMRAVAVSDETKIPEVQSLFANNGIAIPVISRAELLADYTKPKVATAQ